MKPDAADRTPTGSDSGSGTHQSERPELGTNQPDATKPERAGESSEHTPEGPPAPDRQSATPDGPNTGDTHPGIEGTGPYPGDSDPGSSTTYPDTGIDAGSSTTYPDTGIDAGSSSSGPQQTPGAENPTDKATDPAPEASWDGGAHQGERPELGASSDVKGGGAPEATPEPDQEPTAKPEGGGNGDVTVGGVPEALVGAGARSVEGPAVQAAGTVAMGEMRDWTQKTDNRQSESTRPVGSDRGDGYRGDSQAKSGRGGTERWTDDRGNEHQRSQDHGQTKETVTSKSEDGSKTSTTTWTDKNGNTTRIATDDFWRSADGKLNYSISDTKTGISEKGSAWVSDGHVHTDTTTKTPEGTTNVKTDSYKDTKGNEHTHTTTTHTDLIGKTTTKETDTTTPKGAKHP
ncbi:MULTISPECIES: hypothetical protein [unclassified Streptomyces]|uniref:hypothetical protein n=1 Tax=unclassified Streptomyces TaxID=2593676 RepID=UPI002F918B33